MTDLISLEAGSLSVLFFSMTDFEGIVHLYDPVDLAAWFSCGANMNIR